MRRIYRCYMSCMLRSAVPNTNDCAGASNTQDAARPYTPPGWYSSEAATASPASTGSPQAARPPAGSRAGSRGTTLAAAVHPEAPPLTQASAAAEHEESSGRGMPLQLRHAQAVMGEIALRYGLDAPGHSHSGAGTSADWSIGDKVAVGPPERGAGVWALIEDADDAAAARWQVSLDGSERRQGGSPGQRSQGPRGEVVAPCSGPGDSDAVAQLYGPTLAGTPVSGTLVGGNSMVFGGGTGGDAGADRDTAARVCGGGCADGLEGVDDGGEAYSDVGMLAMGDALEDVEGGVVFEAPGGDVGGVFVGAASLGCIGLGQPGVHVVWSDAPGCGVGLNPHCGRPAGMSGAGMYRSAQECTQIELIEDEEGEGVRV